MSNLKNTKIAVKRRLARNPLVAVVRCRHGGSHRRRISSLTVMALWYPDLRLMVGILHYK